MAYRKQWTDPSHKSEAKTYGDTALKTGRPGMFGRGFFKSGKGWRLGQGKWGFLGQSKESSKREGEVIDARKKIESEASKIITGDEYTGSKMKYSYDPFGFGQRDVGLTEGFVEEYDQSGLTKELESTRDLTLQKLSDYLGEGASAGEFEKHMYGDPEMSEYADPTTADIAEGTLGMEAADVRDEELEKLRRDIESGLKTSLDISSPLASLEQQRVRSGMAYHGGLESKRRGLDVTQQEYQREEGDRYATGKAEGEEIYQGELSDILSEFKTTVLNPWKDTMKDYGTRVETGADEYRDYFGNTGHDPLSLLEGSDPFTEYQEKNYARGRGWTKTYDTRWDLPDKESYYGGPAGDLKKMSEFESQRSKSELKKAFPTLEQILGPK